MWTRERSGEDLKHLSVPKQATMERPLTRSWSDRIKGNDFKEKEVRFRCCVRKNFVVHEGDETLEEVVKI